MARPNVSLQEAIENIDIGGPSMLRSAAKNHESVTVVVDPADYEVVAEQIKATGHTTLELRRALAAKVFARTAAYDAAIAAHLAQAFRGSGRPRLCPRHCGSRPRWPRRCATARTRTRKPRSMAVSRVLSATARQGAFLQ